MSRRAILTLAAMIAAAAPALAADPVTVDNFTRAESDFYVKARAGIGCFAVFCHERGPTPVDKQDVIRLNRDTPYSSVVLDLTAPATIEMPDAGKRFQSLMVINQDHYIKHVSYTPGKFTLTRDKVGTRYAVVVIRTFMDPGSPADMEAGQKLQNAIRLKQAGPGLLELPSWDQPQREKLHNALLALAPFVSGSSKMFGDKSEVDEVRHLIGTAAGWGGNRAQDAIYEFGAPKENDGQKAYAITVKDVPVNAFWSVTVYNAKGFYEAPENAISVNNVTAAKDKDGGITIRFGGDPKAANHLRIMPGWNYAVRLYRPRAEILSGKWKFPAAEPVK